MHEAENQCIIKTHMLFEKGKYVFKKPKLETLAPKKEWNVCNIK